MNTKSLYEAASRSLTAQGLSPDVAFNLIQFSRIRQVDEWERIIGRCTRGEVSKVYIVVPDLGSDSPARAVFGGVADWATAPCYIYAPVESDDNIKHFRAFASQGPIGDEEPTLGFYPTSCFEVGTAVKQAVAVEVERDRILGEIDAGRI